MYLLPPRVNVTSKQRDEKKKKGLRAEFQGYSEAYAVEAIEVGEDWYEKDQHILIQWFMLLSLLRWPRGLIISAIAYLFS